MAALSGFQILVDRGRCVIAGHGRLAAAKLLKLDRVPIIRIEHLSNAQMRAFMIADNRLTHISEWDGRLLAQQLKALAEVDLEFNLEVTGFEMAEIDTKRCWSAEQDFSYRIRSSQAEISLLIPCSALPV